jgi:multidrug resistance efflux pump
VAAARPPTNRRLVTVSVTFGTLMGALASVIVMPLTAFPGAAPRAKVESICGGNGARVSLLPPDDASANFVKVLERIPVPLELVDPPADLPLRAGPAPTSG